MSKQMNGHTPGPWVVSEWITCGSGDRPIRIERENWPVVATACAPVTFDDFEIDDVDAPADPSTDEQRAEIDANARLIAASPDLLAACKLQDEYTACRTGDAKYAFAKKYNVRIGSNHSTVHDSVEWWLASIRRAAIKLATGGT